MSWGIQDLVTELEQVMDMPAKKAPGIGGGTEYVFQDEIALRLRLLIVEDGRIQAMSANQSGNQHVVGWFRQGGLPVETLAALLSHYVWSLAWRTE